MPAGGISSHTSLSSHLPHRKSGHFRRPKASARGLKQASDDLLQIEEGSLYPALQRLLREGLLESEEGISAKGRPTRIYKLTNSGARHLEREVSSFEKMFTGITLVLAVAKV
jgi:PadR family transcriptional regulator, regulatory protein PadR